MVVMNYNHLDRQTDRQTDRQGEVLSSLCAKRIAMVI